MAVYEDVQQGGRFGGMVLVLLLVTALGSVLYVLQQSDRSSNGDFAASEAVEEVLDEVEVLEEEAREATEDARAHDYNCKQDKCKDAVSIAEEAVEKVRDAVGVARLIPGITDEHLAQLEESLEVVEGYAGRARAAVEPYPEEGVVIDINPEMNVGFNPSSAIDGDLRSSIVDLEKEP